MVVPFVYLVMVHLRRDLKNVISANIMMNAQGLHIMVKYFPQLVFFLDAMLSSYSSTRIIERLHPDNLVGFSLWYLQNWTTPITTARPKFFSRN